MSGRLALCRRVEEQSVVPGLYPAIKNAPLCFGADRLHFGAGERNAILPPRNGSLSDASYRGELGLADLEDVLADVSDCVHAAYLIRKRIRRKHKIIRIGISHAIRTAIAVKP